MLEKVILNTMIGLLYDGIKTSQNQNFKFSVNVYKHDTGVQGIDVKMTNGKWIKEMFHKVNSKEEFVIFLHEVKDAVVRFNQKPETVGDVITKPNNQQ